MKRGEESERLPTVESSDRRENQERKEERKEKGKEMGEMGATWVCERC